MDIIILTGSLKSSKLNNMGELHNYGAIIKNSDYTTTTISLVEILEWPMKECNLPLCTIYNNSGSLSRFNIICLNGFLISWDYMLADFSFLSPWILVAICSHFSVLVLGNSFNDYILLIVLSGVLFMSLFVKEHVFSFHFYRDLLLGSL